jgi:polysaccharide deacetylase 2 family uncharacterized protein YibQ
MKALAITASAVFVLLLTLIIWFAVAPGPNPGGPAVTIAVTPPPAPPAPPSASGPAPATIDLPPGFGITGTPPAPPQSSPGAPAQPPMQLQSAPPKAPQPQQQAAATPPVVDDAKVTLVAAPVAELVEESRYGPLPKVAADGRRPLDVYSRPSSWATKAALRSPPRIALLIGGMAVSDRATTEVVMKLPAPVSLSYGVYGQNLQDAVNSARAAGHEVILEIPLEPVDYPRNDPGPHTLLTSLPPAENMKRLQWLMSRFTGYAGITNVMGARFVESRDSLVPMFEEIKARGLLFVEEGSVPRSAARDVARALGLSFSIADIRIDALQGPDDIS